MDIRELAERLQDAWNAREEEAFVALHSEDHEIVAPGFSGKGHQGLRDFWALWNGAFPDNRIGYRTLVVEGRQVAQASTFQGTHTGALLGPEGSAIPPTGRSVTSSYAWFATVENGRVARSEFFYDQMDLMGQLGLLKG
jgi:steroid delta-isomerase-like uncharacterized protein